ncbi:Amino acid regulated cytosolic protein [Methylocella tundrae]|uniref:Amino acid regulated cytosolic protein n=1 Tax=Methylocella tundrae TaxID=227605 RepID=A0A4U8YZL3_METTU|nr:Amino acid regulated cytosolic protein [Methylocella tundrae]
MVCRICVRRAGAEFSKSQPDYPLPLFSDILFEARAVAQSLVDLSAGAHVRLGVTGLSRAGKTVFITALIEHLTKATSPSLRGRKNPLPVFRVHAEGRLISGALEPQPDDNVPRFAYEDHMEALAGPDGRVEARRWPQSTRRISELRLRLEYQQKAGLRPGRHALTLDIVDYPGEWLLDLPLLSKSFAQWSRESFAAASTAARAPLSAQWRGFAALKDARAKFNEEDARRAAELFTTYLRACRAEEYNFSSLPPGRFLMPGDLAGSPALTFAPLAIEPNDIFAPDSLAAMMERRYEAYKAHVVKPFFRDHFSRLDRQIVLVDALAALNAGPAAMRDLELALGDVLTAFRAGRGNVLSALFRPKIDRILFAATKADHLHHTSHDRLEAILHHLTARAIARVENVGAEVDVIALAAVRATREARVNGHGGPALEAVIGVPLDGERIGDELFDGKTEAAIFPGELPADPRAVFRDPAHDPRRPALAHEIDYRFVRFRPPVATRAADGSLLSPPHIRLDRALQFLLGDKLT